MILMDLWGNLPDWLILLLTLSCILSAAITLSQYALLSAPSAIIKLGSRPDNLWYLIDKRGRTWQAKLSAQGISSNFCIVLNFHDAKSKRHKVVIIFADAVKPDIFRRLRVYLTLAKRT